MKFDRIRLVNFKPYGDADLRFTDGVTVIHGLNGSGKSSLLEACFFALYGSSALDGTLDDVITNGEEETAVDLWFTHDGTAYHIERRLKQYDGRVAHDCTLETVGSGDDGDTGNDDSTALRDGAREVRTFVTELLRMDAEAFVNCAYVRQGEVNALINATATQRQDIIDDLLQLGTLEEYRDRAGEARLGVEDVLNAKRAVLDEKERQIVKREEQDLHGKLNGLESDLAEVESTIERYETQKRKAERTREEAVATLTESEQNREELATVEADIEEITERIREAERERDELRAAIQEAHERINDRRSSIAERMADAGIDTATMEAVATRREELDAAEADLREELGDVRVQAEGLRNQATNLAAKADDLDGTAKQAAERAERLESEAEAAEAAVKEGESTIEELQEEAADLTERFEGTEISRGEAAERYERLNEERMEARERIAELEAEHKNAKEQVREAEALLDAGKCPECGQPVEESPHAHGIGDHREHVATLETELSDARGEATALGERIESVRELVEAEKRLAEIETRIETVDSRMAEKRGLAEEKREAAEAERTEAQETAERADRTREIAQTKREEAQEATEEENSITEQLTDLEAVQGHINVVETGITTIADAEERIERLRERRESVQELNDERRERLADRRERRDELRETVDEKAIKRARSEKEKAEEYLEKVEPELAARETRRTELQNTIGSVTGEIEALETLRSERAVLAETVERLDSLHQEATDLETAYGDLRAELRQRNVVELERMLNETFELVYGNDAYSHIELDGEYALTVYQKDGEALDPEQLSGGERALFNLSLRCAIYRLLVEGIEGAAPTPPLILDEPTVFLDAGHVSRLVDLVEEMRGFGVRQIIIVSHDEELVGAADELVVVDKDPRTNRSTVRREEAGQPGIAAMIER